MTSTGQWLPYCGVGPVPAEWWGRWNFDPLLLGAMALAAAVLWRSSSMDRRAGYGFLAVAAFLFVSPFCAMGSALFTVRVVHDVMLAVLLGPLAMAALRLHQREFPGSLAVWTAVHALTFWGWHAPPLYAAAMDSNVVFWAMQAAIAGTAALWWAKVLRAPATAAAASLLGTMIAMGVLGALFVFSQRAFYAPHWLTTQAWGFSPLEDQQLAGIVMWAPASAIYLLAAMAILYRSIGDGVRA
ncbi:cytochrome c oxidase assembly protein [Altericroceibacterium xinjiangense]|uniref:cytochrome c oxidase assembly protein n=1 Tax=Altericroceibacterium xinjiangense TaxID=762261 RepID=UPI000F7E2EEC|nr:cytochrome c oxidase assembly protein [Altericroceibacterium xinjiangense]